MKKFAVASCLVVLAGCGSMGGDSGAMKPGKWQMTSEIVSLEAPGMTPAMVEQMKGAAKATPIEMCLTPEMVAKPGADFFGAPKGGNCKTEKMEVGGGKIAAKLSCDVSGMAQTFETNGTVSAESYELQSTVNAEVPGMGTTKTVMKTSAKRIGDC